jgi:hypothetical protein
VPKQREINSNSSQLKQLNLERHIDFTMRKPIQKQEFNTIFDKIQVQLHLSLLPMSASMSEIIYQQINTDNMAPSSKLEGIVRSISAYVNTNGQGHTLLSFN